MYSPDRKEYMRAWHRAHKAEHLAYCRAYYVQHREHILAANRRCAAKRKRFWKKKCRPLRTVACADCGGVVYAPTAVRYPHAPKPMRFYRCGLCAEEAEACEAKLPLRSDLARRHLFLYADALSPLAGAAEADGLYLDEVEALEKAKCGLDARERLILGMRMEGWELSRVGSKLGLSKERIRQLQIKALRKLRKALGFIGASVLSFRS